MTVYVSRRPKQVTKTTVIDMDYIFKNCILGKSYVYRNHCFVTQSNHNVCVRIGANYNSL